MSQLVRELVATPEMQTMFFGLVEGLVECFSPQQRDQMLQEALAQFIITGTDVCTIKGMKVDRPIAPIINNCVNVVKEIYSEDSKAVGAIEVSAPKSKPNPKPKSGKNSAYAKKVNEVPMAPPATPMPGDEPVDEVKEVKPVPVPKAPRAMPMPGTEPVNKGKEQKTVPAPMAAPASPMPETKYADERSKVSTHAISDECRSTETPPSSPRPSRISTSNKRAEPHAVNQGPTVHTQPQNPRKARGPNKPRPYGIIGESEINPDDAHIFNYFSMEVVKTPMYRGKPATTWYQIRGYINTHRKEFLRGGYFIFHLINVVPTYAPDGTVTHTYTAREIMDAKTLAKQLDEIYGSMQMADECDNAESSVVANLPDTKIVGKTCNVHKPLRTLKGFKQLGSTADKIKDMTSRCIKMSNVVLDNVVKRNLAGPIAVCLKKYFSVNTSIEEVTDYLEGYCYSEESVINAVFAIFLNKCNV